jgi:acyl-CoA thioester hydrolase
MAEPFTVRVRVRGYELDVNGHLNQSVYLQYAEHARWELIGAAGISMEKLFEAGVGPVVLETTIRYRRELRDGDEVGVSCAFGWGSGKTFRVSQDIRLTNGVLAADVRSVGGLMSLGERRLVADPAGRLRELATAPELLDLDYESDLAQVSGPRSALSVQWNRSCRTAIVRA